MGAFRKLIKRTHVTIKSSIFAIKNLLLKFFNLFLPTSRTKKYQKQIIGQSNLDKKLVLSLSKSRIPNFRQFKYIKRYLSPKEVWAIRISFFVIFLSLIFSGTRFYMTHLQVVPVAGGVYREGINGKPSLINPLYAVINDADSDLTSLIFSSLFKRSKDGQLMKDLVEEYEISEDGKEYSITIRSDAFWHDDDRTLNADDIIFTFNAIKDKAYKSPLRMSFIGVEVERIDDYKFKFILTESYAAFLELLTFGVMPSEIWSQVPIEKVQYSPLNLKPIGSGPYKISEIKRETTKEIHEYHLVVNEQYYGNKPRVDIVFKYYQNTEETIAALNNNLVDSINRLPFEYKEDIKLPKVFDYHKLRMPNITLVFLNEEQNSSLGDKAARQALTYSIDRNRIINQVLDGYGDIVNSPIISNSFAYNENVNQYKYDIIKAEKLLENIDWKIVEVTKEAVTQAEENKDSDDEATKNKALAILEVGEGKWRMKNGEYFVIRLTTVDRSENNQIVNMIADFWENIGVKAIIEIVPTAKMQTEIIKPRNFEALFYGQILSADPDSYIFWHSSQIGEEGYNIAGYSNKDVDQLLEDGRLTSDQGVRQEKYRKFQEIISEEAPVIFMYSPNYLYLQNKKVKGFSVNNIVEPSNRFANIDEWYIEVGKKLIW